jgi:membrane fusion protein, copper/silver efflux system
MKRPALLLSSIGLLVLLAGAGGYWLALQRMPKQTEASGRAQSGAAQAPAPAAPAAGDTIDPKTGRKVLYWHDPMVPDRKFDKPGKSPYMDMQLVPVYADEAADEGKVSISSRTAQNLGIRTAEVTQGNLETRFSAVGVVSVDERSIFTVQSRVSGYIERLYVRAQYDNVARGQRLVEIYAPDWLAAQEEYLALKRSAQPGADQLAQAARERLLLLGVSEAQISAIEADGKANPRISLSAPDSGVVWELGVRDGMAVSPGMTLFKLAALGTVWVNAEVPETQAALIKPGLAVQGHVATFPDEVFRGKVAALLPDVNATTRTIRARIVLSNPKAELKPGMFATLDFGGHRKQALLVSAEAVIYTGTRNVVISADGNGGFRPVEVEVGRESGDMIEIRKGLEVGQKVVVSGQFLVDSEASLKTTLERMNPPRDAGSLVDRATQRGGGKQP